MRWPWCAGRAPYNSSAIAKNTRPAHKNYAGEQGFFLGTMLCQNEGGECDGRGARVAHPTTADISYGRATRAAKP